MPDLSADERPGESVPIAVRAQILSTEHWSLLATRSLAWSESFSRASWFVTVVSATVVALALVANSTRFGLVFRVFALLLVPLLLLQELQEAGAIAIYDTPGDLAKALDDTPLA